MSQNDIFKTCSQCGYIWTDMDHFLSDSFLEIIGYQANFFQLKEGLFLFNHFCGGTLAVPVHLLRTIYEGPVFTKRMAGSESCPGHCLRKNVLDACSNQCECAWVREVIQRIKKWPKQTIPA